MSKASVYADLSGIDRQVIDALMPTLEGQDDGSVVDQLLNLAPSLEGVDVSLVVELIGQLQHRSKKDAVIGGLIEFFQQSGPKSRQQSAQFVEVTAAQVDRSERSVERSVSPSEHDLVETISPQQQRKGGRGGILSWFTYSNTNTPQADSSSRLRPVTISETPQSSSQLQGEEFGWKFDDQADSPPVERRYNDLPTARDFADDSPGETDDNFDEVLQQFVAAARKTYE